MNLDIFKTPKHLPFLFYARKVAKLDDLPEEKIPSLTLDMWPSVITETPSFDDLWTTIDLGDIASHEMGLYIATNKLANEVARGTRRACANIFIVQNAEKKALLDEHNIKYKFTETQTFVDSSLKPNELRATYWKICYERKRVGDDIITTDNPLGVDGGIQFCPFGFSCIRKDHVVYSDYHNYFVRGFL